MSTTSFLIQDTSLSVIEFLCLPRPVEWGDNGKCGRQSLLLFSCGFGAGSGASMLLFQELQRFVLINILHTYSSRRSVPRQTIPYRWSNLNTFIWCYFQLVVDWQNSNGPATPKATSWITTEKKGGRGERGSTNPDFRLLRDYVTVYFYCPVDF